MSRSLQDMTGFAKITLVHSLSGRREVLQAQVCSLWELRRMAPPGARFFKENVEINREAQFSEALKTWNEESAAVELDVVVDARLLFLPKVLRKLQGVHERTVALQNIADTMPEFWGDRLCVLAAVMLDGLLLEHVEDDLRSDPEVLRAAALQNGEALRYAPEAARDDASLLLSVDVRAFSHASQRLRSDRDFVLKAAQRFGPTLRLASPELWGDLELATVAAGSVGGWMYFEHAHPNHRSNVVVAEAAMQSIAKHHKTYWSKRALASRVEPCFYDSFEDRAASLYREHLASTLATIVLNLGPDMAPQHKDDLIKWSVEEAEKAKCVSLHRFLSVPFCRSSTTPIDENSVDRLAGPSPDMMASQSPSRSDYDLQPVRVR